MKKGSKLVSAVVVLTVVGGSMISESNKEVGSALSKLKAKGAIKNSILKDSTHTEWV